jgi:pyruvate dehydrogenase E1 component alpha subunit
MATETIVEKADAYGMPGVRVDGFDPLACWKATKDALDRGRAGEGPTLIEAFCYRLGAHGTADDPRLYRDETEVEGWKPLEPVSRMSAYLKRLGVLDDDKSDEIHQEAKDAIAWSVKEMEAVGQPDQEILFEHVYASERPWTFHEGLEELRSVSRPPEVKPVGPQAGPSTGDAEDPPSPPPQEES